MEKGENLEMKRHKALKKFLVLVLLISIFSLSFGLKNQVHASSQTGLWIGASVCSLLYLPLKTAFFLLMGISGALSVFVTAPMDRMDVSQRLYGWGFYGDWLVRPDHFSEEKFPQFIGVDEEIRFVFIDPRLTLAQNPAIVN